MAKTAQTGAVTKQDPQTADTPSAAGGQSLVPRSAAVNAFDPSAVENVLTSAGQLLVDVNIELPRRILEASAVNFDDFLHDATRNPFDTVSALTRFFAAEGATIMAVGDAFDSVVGDDTLNLYDAIGAVFGVKPSDEGVVSAKTVIKPGATAVSPVSGVVDKTTAKGQQGLDPGSKGVTGKHSQDGSARPAKVHAPGPKGDTAPAKQSGTEIKDQSPSNSTDATKGDTTKGEATKGTPRRAAPRRRMASQHRLRRATFTTASPRRQMVGRRTRVRQRRRAPRTLRRIRRAQVSIGPPRVATAATEVTRASK